MSLRRLTFHRVLHRPSLFLGGEREPALMTAVIAGGSESLGGTLTASANQAPGTYTGTFPITVQYY